jgi:uridine phosphorylase
MMQTSLGPNTNAPFTVLTEQCILCAGEDRQDLSQALAESLPIQARQQWHYRDYEFWRFDDFCVIRAGLGSGSLEPLLFEILRPQILQRVILIGTAGVMPDAILGMGEPYLVDRAWAAGTAIDEEAGQLPLRPRWNCLTTVPKASCVSSDFFYGFAPRILTSDYPARTQRLRMLFEQHLRLGTQMVDMEIAQFYYFCAQFGAGTLEYVAVKGVANAVGREGEQRLNTGKAIAASLAVALQLFRESEVSIQHK